MPANNPVCTGGCNTLAVAAPTSNTVVKGVGGYLHRVLVVAANGANPILIYDNATTNSGTVIGIVPANSAIGTIIDCNMPAALGITIAATASSGALTVSYD